MSGAKSRSRITLAKLYSQAGTGFMYYLRRPRTAPKFALRKYDPIVRSHVLFSETKPTIKINK